MTIMAQKAATIVALALGAVCGAAASAQTVTAELRSLEGSQVKLYAYDFLAADELALLRLVGSNKDALATFVPDQNTFAAMAVHPAEGFVRNGAPVASAVALSGFDNEATARKAALDACAKAKSASGDCLILLEISPVK